MTRTLALPSILVVPLFAAACANPNPQSDAPSAAPTNLALSSVNCLWWYRNSDPGPIAQRERFLKCTSGSLTIRIDSSGIGQNGGE
ncbi:MAG TPA: hypothetical protein VF128_11205 [Gemmatimonadaceae bacterium]